MEGGVERVATLIKIRQVTVVNSTLFFVNDLFSPEGGPHGFYLERQTMGFRLSCIVT